MSNATTIRSFRIAYEEFRHVIDLSTDEVFLQHKDDNEWKNLIRFDSSCDVWDMDGKRIGHFSIKAEHWVFDNKATGESITCEHSRGAESLLDSEVTISRRWIAANHPAA